MTTLPRLRFAPSPTGFFHVGSARTTLYNWYLARQTGGTFVLRIEDTDTARNRPEWSDGILAAIRWIGADWDEGPFFQSERTALYANAVARLLADGRAYYCDCERTAVEARNVEAFGPKEKERGYDGHCRSRGLTAGAVRFRMPDEGTTTVVDLIRGEPEFDNSLLEDFVIQRTNGEAMFLLANVVDDIDMRITHVVRGEEHLPNTPKAVRLWQALAPEVPLPVFAHLPVLVNEQRKKLSKRRDKVALEDFELLGMLPEAMRNFLTLLGWSPGGDREYLTVEECIAEFRLEDCTPSPAFFDLVKMEAFNATYLRALSAEELVLRFERWLADLSALRTWPDTATAEIAVSQLGEGRQEPPPLSFNPARFDPRVLHALAPMVQERAKLLSDIAPMLAFFFHDEPVMDKQSWDKTMSAPGAVEMLDGVLKELSALGDNEFTTDRLKDITVRVGEASGLKLGKAQAPIRVATTGSTVGLPLFEALEVLGRDRTVARLVAARARLP